MNIINKIRSYQQHPELEVQVASMWLVDKLTPFDANQITNYINSIKSTGITGTQLQILMNDFTVGPYKQYSFPTIKQTVEDIIDELY